MAYRRRSTSRTRSAARSKRNYSSRRPARRNSGVRSRASSSRQTLRIVLETPQVSAVARPSPFQTEKADKKAQF